MYHLLLFFLYIFNIFSSKETDINVFILIPGTSNVKKAISFFEILSRCFDIKNSYYYNTKKNRYSPSDKFSYSMLTQSNFNTLKKGLDKIIIDDKNLLYTRDGAHLICSQIEDSLLSISDEKRDYYVYNWSTILSQHARHKAGKKLYLALKNLVIEYKNEKKIPIFHVIGYSHGGTIAAEMEFQMKKENLVLHSSRLVIENLILLATPMGKYTKNLLNSTLFKNIFNFYSKKDLIQQYDFTFLGWGIGRSAIIELKNKNIFNINVMYDIFNKKIHLNHALFGRFLFPDNIKNKSDISNINKIPFISFAPYISFILKKKLENNFYSLDLIIKKNSKEEIIYFYEIPTIKKKFTIYEEKIKHYTNNLIKTYAFIEIHFPSLAKNLSPII